MRSAATALVVAVAMLLPGAAEGAPVQLGSGRNAAVALDAGNTAYVAWAGNEPTGSTLQFCRLPAGATACDVRTALPAPGDSVTRPFVMVQGSVVRVLQYRFGLTNGLTPDRFAAIYLFTSTNAGASFDAGVQVGTVPFTDATVGPGGGVSLATNAVTQGELYQRVPIDGSAPATAAANLSVDHPYNGAVGLIDPATPLVMFTDASGNAQFRRYTGSGDVNDAASWTPAQNVGQADSLHLAGGPSGLFVLGTLADGHLGVRRFDGTTFAPGVAVPNGRGETPQDHLSQDAGGMLHVLLPQITANCCVLLHAFSPNGTNWTTTSFPVGTDLASQVWADFRADHSGIAVWHGGTGAGANVFALRLAPPQARPIPGRTGNATVVSGTVLIRLPGSGRFAPLTSATAVPVGSQLDTTRGTVRLTVALRRSGGTASAKLSGGRFRFTQPLRGSGKLRTDLALKGGSFKGCPAPGKGGSARRRTIRYLKTQANGKFNVIGRQSSGVERGTTWTTKDTCTTTTTSVKAGSVAVRDFARRKTVIVRAGKTYVARARGRK